MKRVIIFVDANNWYHNLKKSYKPGDIDILKVKNLIAKQYSFKILDVYWYSSIPNIHDNPLIYKKQRAFLGILQRAGIKVIIRKLQSLSTKEIKQKRKEMLESWHLCKTCKPIVEESFLEIADHQKKEKGIDVWIAIDMVKHAYKDSMDCCVLISGDADFVPALSLVKDIGKEVLSVSVPRGYSNELRQKFNYFILGKEKLKQCIGDYTKKK